MKLSHRMLALASLLLAPSLLAATIQETAPRAAVEAQTAPSSSSGPFLWRIEGAGGAGYLYGTIHLPDERVLALPDVVKTALDSCSAFFAEIDATTASEMQVQRAAMLGPGDKLDVLVGQATWARVEDRFARAGLPPLVAASMTGMKPWAVNAILPMVDYLPDLMGGKAPLDKFLYERAKQSGKKVGGLETVEEQIAVFEIFDQAQQIQMLRESLDLLDEYDRENRRPMEEMVVAWLSGDERQLVKLLDDGFGTDPVLREMAEHELLWKRNVRLADRIVERLEASPENDTFFAVGALHMPDAPAPEAGPDGTVTETPQEAEVREAKKGLLVLLRAKGYSVVRVPAAAASPASAPGK